MIFELEDITSQYSFTFELPNYYEYCGNEPPWFCSVGVPDSYYSIDTSLTSEIVLVVETNKRDQEIYDYYNPYFVDSLVSVYREFALRFFTYHEKINRQEKLDKLNLVFLDSLEVTKAIINNITFYGHGTERVTKSGMYFKEYSIWVRSLDL